MTATEIQALASVATFVAAGLAVWATFRAPKLAAEFAERIRRDSQIADEERRLKLWIFTTLMQNRANIPAQDSVSALNLIDIVYKDAEEVRAAWRHFFDAVSENPTSPDKIIERYLAIIEKMARHLGLSSGISVQDIKRVYYPVALGHRDEAFRLEVSERLNRLRNSMPT